MLSPSTPEISAAKSDQRKQGRWVARLGVVLFAGPLLGLVGTMIGMVTAFMKLQDGVQSPATLSSDVNLALMSTMLGLVAGLLGAALILAAVFATKNRETWFFRWTVFLSVVWCVSVFPYGLIVGVPMLIWFLSMRAEFQSSPKTV